MEVTDRFPTDVAARTAVAGSDAAAARAYAALAAGLPAGHLVVACWTKPQFSNDRSYPVTSATALKLVVGGIREGRCTNLRFFHLPTSQAPHIETSYQTLFMP